MAWPEDGSLFIRGAGGIGSYGSGLGCPLRLRPERRDVLEGVGEDTRDGPRCCDPLSDITS